MMTPTPFSTNFTTLPRVCYVARFAEAIYVLHAFEKRTQKTPAKDIDLARTRYRELLRWRREQGYGKG
jgi:phage-related protein